MLHDRRGIESLVPAGRSLATQDPPLAIKFAEVLIQGGRLNEALELLKLTVVSTPKNVTALLLLVRTEIVLKDIPKAATYLLRAEKIEPHSSELLFVKALFESEQGNFARSVEFFERSLAKNPMDKTVLSRFVIVAIQANQSSKAVAAARSLLNLEPRNLDFLYLDGVSSLQNNDLIHAEMSLKRYTEARPKDPRGCLALGMTYAAHSDRLDEALRQLAYCIITDPNNFEASYQLGLSYKNMGDLAKAAEFLEQAIEHSPNHAFALRDLGAVYLQMGEEAKARPLLEKAVSQNPSDADTHFQLSRLYDLIGERELGKKHLEIFRKLKEGKKEGM